MYYSAWGRWGPVEGELFRSWENGIPASWFSVCSEVLIQVSFHVTWTDTSEDTCAQRDVDLIVGATEENHKVR